MMRQDRFLYFTEYACLFHTVNSNPVAFPFPFRLEFDLPLRGTDIHDSRDTGRSRFQAAVLSAQII